MADSPYINRFLQPDTLIPDPANPQALNRYSYVTNRPVNFNDPTGHCADGLTTILCAAVAGAIIGAAISYGSQVARNVSDGGLSVEAFTNVDGSEIATAAISGAVAGTVGAVVGLAAAAAGVTSLAGTIVAGAMGGAASGQASRAAANVKEGRKWSEGLGNARDIVTDGVIGGLTAGISHIVGRIKFSSKYIRGDFEIESTTQYNIRKSVSGGGAGYAEYDTATGRALYRVDLEGASHGTMPTPHLHNAKWNLKPGDVDPTFGGWGTKNWKDVFPSNSIKDWAIRKMIQ